MPATVAQIAVDQAAFHFDRLYSYRLTEEAGGVRRGCRVLVPFGGGNRTRQGIVVSLETVPDAGTLKPVRQVLDRDPLLNDEMLELALWLKERTFCTVFDAVRAMLPTGLYMRVRPRLHVAVDIPPSVLDSLTPEEKQILAAVSRCPEGAGQDALLKRLGLQAEAPALAGLLEKGALVRTEDASRLAGDLRVRMARLRLDGDELEEALKGCTDKQKRVVRLLQEVGAASVKELSYYTSVTAAVPAALEKKGVLEFYEHEMLRSPCQGGEERPAIVSSSLSGEQAVAFADLLARYREHKPAGALLYGVTGSGKTQVYMNLIDQVLEDGRQALVLVPEISLTPQMMNLFLSKYGRRVAVLHSGLAIGERMDEWKRIRRGEASVVVGTRSAVFAPCERIGLIVMDEEQEHTYKSESSPRYHARDVARFRCAKHGALLLLTSATPSIESYHAAKAGRYSLHELPSRYGAAQLPEVEVADMRQEETGDAAIGPTLRAAMRQTLDEGRQVILLLNRRGFHTHVSCRSCGHVLTCPSCSISMIYHRANGRLMCHYCGHMEEPARLCPACGSDKIRYSGQGTQRVEQELEELFPGVPVLRMDADTAMSRFAYEQKFGEFARGEYRILIGTQMVAKGLDFPEVGLVGVLSADQALYGDDFRSYETTFSLLTQVIGRAGRRDTPGKAVIQTYTPENYVIALAARQDYAGFYELEIAGRKMMKYPPYTDLCLFGFVGTQEEGVRQAALRFLQELRRLATGEFADLPMIVLDPTPAAVARVAGKYRYKVLVKTVNNARLRQLAARLLIETNRRPENKLVTAYADINPANVL